MRRKRSSAKPLGTRRTVVSRRHALRRAATRGHGVSTRRPALGLKATDLAQKRNDNVAYAAAVKNFEAAVRQFQKRNYERAKEIFEKLAETAPLEVADRAKVHLSLCSQRLAPQLKLLKTAEEYYVAGVSALNARRLDRAVECLARSAKLDPKREETHYSLAAAYALQGKPDPAIDHLKISIGLRPANLFQARADEDLRRLSSDPRFIDLLQLEPAVTARTGA